VARLWIVPVAAVHGFGLGLAWVRRGFQVEHSSPLPARPRRLRLGAHMGVQRWFSQRC
jgi:hypothetical protein